MSNLNYRAAKAEFERAFLVNALTACGGGVNRTARATGLSKVTLIQRIKKFGIEVEPIKYAAHQSRKLTLVAPAEVANG